MSTRCIHEMNDYLALAGPKAVSLLRRAPDCAAACDRAGVQLDAVERRFLTSIPTELWVSIRATMIAALEADRKVTVDWAPAFSHEVSVSVPKRSGYDAVTILLRTPSPRPRRTPRQTSPQGAKKPAARTTTGRKPSGSQRRTRKR